MVLNFPNFIAWYKEFRGIFYVKQITMKVCLSYLDSDWLWDWEEPRRDTAVTKGRGNTTCIVHFLRFVIYII